MSSILTNGAALAALQTLRNTDTNLEKTQGRISSGYRVAKAADNAAYWSIATTMRSDVSALSTTMDAMGLAAAKTDTTYAGLEQAIDLVKTIKSKLVAAAELTADKDKVNKEITELKNQLVSAAASSSFSGENWLYNTSTVAVGTKEMVGSFTRNADGTISVQTINFDASKSVLCDKSSAARGLLTGSVGVTYTTTTQTNTTNAQGVRIQVQTNTTAVSNFFLVNLTSTTSASGTEIKISSTTSANDLQNMTNAVEKILTTLTDVAAQLGAVQNRVNTQNTFVKNLVDVMQKGVGRLVDADMNEESTRLKALQTQQQLGIQSLSIANTNAENILQLFRQ